MAKVTKDVTNIHTKQREEEKPERMLLEGVRSGRGIEVGSKEWKEFRQKLSAFRN